MTKALEGIKEALAFKFKYTFSSAFRTRTRELARLQSLPRYQATTTDLFLDTRLQVVDAYTFLAMYEDIFEREPYHFTCKTESPYILDGGANIGLSVLYFKRLFPNSEIIAFEPDETVFNALEYNLRELRNVTLVRAALWSSEATREFYPEGSVAGRLSQQRISSKTKYQVKTERLAKYLMRHVDFLKLDIEGAEIEVLSDCERFLGNVDRIFVEYHSFPERPQSLVHLFDILAKTGFRAGIYGSGSSTYRPFSTRSNYLGMDLQLNIFAYRT